MHLCLRADGFVPEIETHTHTRTRTHTHTHTHTHAGSGKSYTMMGPEDDKGLIPRLCEQLFARIAEQQSDVLKFHVEVAYMEIYNEKVRAVCVLGKWLANSHTHTHTYTYTLTHRCGTSSVTCGTKSLSKSASTLCLGHMWRT